MKITTKSYLLKPTPYFIFKRVHLNNTKKKKSEIVSIVLNLSLHTARENLTCKNFTWKLVISTYRNGHIIVITNLISFFFLLFCFNSRMVVRCLLFCTVAKSRRIVKYYVKKGRIFENITLKEKIPPTFNNLILFFVPVSFFFLQFWLFLLKENLYRYYNIINSLNCEKNTKITPPKGRREFFI